MAIARQGVFVAPSVDKKLLSELNSTQIEAGIYHCNEQFAIGSVVSDKWTVLVFSNETKDGLECLSQLWTTVLPNTDIPRMFLRTSAPGETTYSEFNSFINCHTDQAVDLYIGGEEPTAEDGITKIYIDLN